MKIKTKGGKNSRVQPIARGSTKQKSPAGFKSIIVPIDFSETSIKALDYAIAMAKEFGSKIHMVHVLEFPAVFNSTAQPSYAIYDKEAKRLATARLDELVDEKIDEGTTVTFEVRFGRAYKAICETVKEQKADLIVIGTHGFTGLKHLLLGSTAERVIRHAPCTVMTVCKQQIRKIEFVAKPKKILVPTDFSKPADAALQAAAVLAQQFQAQIHLIHVVPSHDAVGEYYKIDRQLLESGEMEACQKKLAALSKTLIAKKISVKIEIRRGRPAVEITKMAEELDADLIAISTQGRTGWQHALLGSVTEEVVRHSLCPVLVVRKK